MFGIEEALKDLGLKNDNNGTSTGVDGFGNGKKYLLTLLLMAR